MVKAVRIHEPGGPEALRYEDVSPEDPRQGEVRLRHTAIGLNYIDIYLRSGLYPLPELPAVIGMEGAGVVVAVGPGVTELREGERVAYAGGPPGAYAEERNIPAQRLVKLPSDLEEHKAAGMMLRGMTVRYLIKRTYPVKEGDTVLFHAAAGGVGLIACQWLSHIGATVIGTVGSPEKAELARAHGCHHTVDYSKEDFVERVQELTDGKGVPVVYDSVGKSTFMGSLDCLQPLGMMVTFGNASGPVDPIQPALLGQKGSLFLTRPSLMHYTAEREDLVETAEDLFDVVRGGYVQIEIGQTYPLAETAQAHRDLESRRTTGSTILLP